MSCFLSNSSLGKKLVMSVTGVFLVLFILFHMSMNITAIISPEAYNMICELLGANWYALAGTAVLALGVFVHFLYAVILTLNNYKARGSQRYAVTVQEPGVAWASKNMLVLGFIILGGLLIHLFNFWSKMQLVEILGGHENSLGLDPADGDFADRLHLLAVVLRGDLPRMVRRPVVPPHARRMVDVPDRGLGQRHVVSPPEVHRQHRGHDHIPRIRRRGARLLLLPLHRRRMLITPFVE